jgi:hypothetical protein
VSFLTLFFVRMTDQLAVPQVSHNLVFGIRL